MKRNISLIGYHCGMGAQIGECYQGADSLKKWKLADKLKESAINCQWEKSAKVTIPRDDSDKYVEASLLELYSQVKDSLKAGNLPVTIGGDHSMAIGTWSAVADYYNIKRNMGLIWIDAHLDAHTPDTSPSNAIHGMPSACLMGIGFNQLVNLGSDGTKINPEHVVYIGIRSYEDAEYHLLNSLGTKIYTIDDVRKSGFDTIINESIAHITSKTDGFGITIDLDAFDPERAPGVGSPEKNGLLRQEVFSGLQGLGLHEKLRAVEIAEYNPDLDIDNKTKRLIFRLIECLFHVAGSNRVGSQVKNSKNIPPTH